MSQKAFDLAAEHKMPVFVIIIERLNAKNIACAEQSAGVFIPDGKGEHTAQLAGQLLAPLLVAVQQHLGVTVRGKGVPGGNQFFAQRLKIVDFAVEHHHQRAVLVVHGLLAAL